jgi:hypothetical protein
MNDKQGIRRNQENVFEKFLAYSYPENSGKAIYGSLMNNLKQQQSLKHDQYPKTIANVSSALNSLKFNDLKRNDGEKNKDDTEKSKIQEDNSDLPKLSLAQMGGKCYCCCKTFHECPKCNDKNKKEKNGISIRSIKLKFKGIEHM